MKTYKGASAKSLFAGVSGAGFGMNSERFGIRPNTARRWYKAEWWRWLGTPWEVRRVKGSRRWCALHMESGKYAPKVFDSDMEARKWCDQFEKRLREESEFKALLELCD